MLKSRVRSKSPDTAMKLSAGSRSRPSSRGGDLSPRAAEILAELKRQGGECSVATLGHILKSPSGGTSNPGTLAATSVLRSLEKRGIVSRRRVYGPGYGRTLWRLLRNNSEA